MLHLTGHSAVYSSSKGTPGFKCLILILHFMLDEVRKMRNINSEIVPREDDNRKYIYRSWKLIRLHAACIKIQCKSLFIFSPCSNRNTISGIVAVLFSMCFWVLFSIFNHLVSGTEYMYSIPARSPSPKHCLQLLHSM